MVRESVESVRKEKKRSNEEPRLPCHMIVIYQPTGNNNFYLLALINAPSL